MTRIKKSIKVVISKTFLLLQKVREPKSRQRLVLGLIVSTSGSITCRFIVGLHQHALHCVSLNVIGYTEVRIYKKIII